MSDVTIRLATEQEYDAVGELTVAAYVADGPMGSYVDVLRNAAGRAAVGELLVAADGDELVGTATLIPPGAPPQWREKTPADGATVRMVAVAPSARGRGVGTMLTLACIGRARARKWPLLCLLTVDRMQTAQRIYTRLGFVRDPALDWQIDSGLLLGYSLDLSAAERAIARCGADKSTD